MNTLIAQLTVVERLDKLLVSSESAHLKTLIYIHWLTVIVKLSNTINSRIQAGHSKSWPGIPGCWSSYKFGIHLILWQTMNTGQGNDETNYLIINIERFSFSFSYCNLKTMKTVQLLISTVFLPATMIRLIRASLISFSLWIIAEAVMSGFSSVYIRQVKFCSDKYYDQSTFISVNLM